MLAVAGESAVPLVVGESARGVLPADRVGERLGEPRGDNDGTPLDGKHGR